MKRLFLAFLIILAPAAKARSRIRDRLVTGEAFRAACPRPRPAG